MRRTPRRTVAFLKLIWWAGDPFRNSCHECLWIVLIMRSRKAGKASLHCGGPYHGISPTLKFLRSTSSVLNKCECLKESCISQAENDWFNGKFSHFLYWNKQEMYMRMKPNISLVYYVCFCSISIDLYVCFVLEKLYTLWDVWCAGCFCRAPLSSVIPHSIQQTHTIQNTNGL